MIKFLLHHLLTDTSVRFPNKIAVVCGENSITYRELDKKSDYLAEMLVLNGFEERSTIGIYLEKSVEAIIAIFAILKAGGVYVPLDSYYSPLPRIKSVIKLSEMKYLISDISRWNSIISCISTEESVLFKDIKVILTDTLNYNGKSSISLYDSKNKASYNSFFYKEYFVGGIRKKYEGIDNDLAYILYTSGSTGLPKGVMLTHLNAMTFINWALSTFNPTCVDVFSSFAPLHFDLSVFDIFVSVAAGGCLYLLPTCINNNPRAIVDWLSKNKITYMYSVPSLWVSILNYANVEAQSLMELKHILFAGEVFPPKYLKQLMNILSHSNFYNLYGPTETNVCMFYKVQNEADIWDRPVPIGSACANTQIIVLNDNGEEVSEGEAGELLVRGSIVSKGYYRDEEQTRKVFIKSPLSKYSGELFYKTGDIVRKCGDEIFEFIGRNDLMVKYAGFRIELEEIEHVLYKNEIIEEAVAIPFVRQDDRKSVSIMALVKIREGKKSSVTDIKNFVADILPKYMIPEVIRLVNEIPKNSNGKIDRQRIKEYSFIDEVPYEK